MNDLVGVGWAFPVGVNHRGGIALARGERDIEEAIRIVLLTPKGQRVMRPTFGSNLHTLCFAPNVPSTWTLAEYYVEEALRFWEPRIRLISVQAGPDPDNRHVLQIAIVYEVKTTMDRRTLVFPFYRIPDDPA